jgi:hypothetical protein
MQTQFAFRFESSIAIDIEAIITTNCRSFLVVPRHEINVRSTSCKIVLVLKLEQDLQNARNREQQHVTVIGQLAAGVYENDTVLTIWREVIGDKAVRGIQKFAQVYSYLGELVSGTLVEGKKQTAPKMLKLRSLAVLTHYRRMKRNFQ